VSVFCGTGQILAEDVLDSFEKRLRHLALAALGIVNEVHKFVGIAIHVRVSVYETNVRVLAGQLFYEQ
jgi:hypothetical protein